MRQQELLKLIQDLYEAAEHPEVKAAIYNPAESHIGAIAVKFTSGATGYIKSFKSGHGVQR